MADISTPVMFAVDRQEMEMTTSQPDELSVVYNAQHEHWEHALLKKPGMFGEAPSYAARMALELFKKESKTNILEPGGGQGRDTLFFAQNSLRVHVIDYTESGLQAITRRAEALALTSSVFTVCHDVRRPLPFDAETFDGCYSHMLYCMALTTRDLKPLSNEIRRVLKPDGINFYTVRHTGDAD